MQIIFNNQGATVMVQSWTTHPIPVGWKTSKKAEKIANIQMQYYSDKVNNIKKTLPRVNSDPIKYLKWDLKGGHQLEGIPNLLSKVLQLQNFVHDK